MAWFKRDKKSIEQSTPPEERKVRTEGLWVKCESCRTIVFRKDLEANLLICPKCGFHFKMNAKQRLEMLLDGRWTEHDARMTSTDPLKFVDTKPYRLDDAPAFAMAGQHDDGGVGIALGFRLPDHLGQFEAVENRHRPVGDDDIGP